MGWLLRGDTPAERPEVRPRLRGGPELRLRKLTFQSLADASGDPLGRACGISGQVVLAHVDEEHGTVPERVDPLCVARVELFPVARVRVALFRAPALGDAPEDRLEWRVEINQQPRGTRGRR